MELMIDHSLMVSDFTFQDKESLLEHFKEKQIYDQTLNIPFPYTDADADWWIQYNLDITQKNGGRSTNWALRTAKDHKLIGGIGFLNLNPHVDHKAELGYWLAKPYWNQKIMSKTVEKICEYGFVHFGLIRIAAHVFEFNQASAKVLEKCGFKREAHLRKYYKKDGKIFDGIAYALVKD